MKREYQDTATAPQYCFIKPTSLSVIRKPLVVIFGIIRYALHDFSISSICGCLLGSPAPPNAIWKVLPAACFTISIKFSYDICGAYVVKPFW